MTTYNCSFYKLRRVPILWFHSYIRNRFGENVDKCFQRIYSQHSSFYMPVLMSYLFYIGSIAIHCICGWKISCFNFVSAYTTNALLFMISGTTSIIPFRYSSRCYFPSRESLSIVSESNWGAIFSFHINCDAAVFDEATNMWSNEEKINKINWLI